MRHKKSGFIDRLSGFSRCKPIFITPASFYYIVQFLPLVFLDFDILPHCDAKGGAEKKKSIEKPKNNLIYKYKSYNFTHDFKIIIYKGTPFYAATMSWFNQYKHSESPHLASIPQKFR